ncbi:MAG: glycoside hydrolase family 43 protein [Bacillus sp. (in: firmicutes)]
MDRKGINKAIFSISLMVILLIGIGVWYLMNKEETITYKNPVGGITNIGDPFVLKDGNNYYMYATSEASVGFKVWQSSNLVDWKENGFAYHVAKQPNQWAVGDFWAPEVIKHNDQYYMTYSARDNEGHLQISIAMSKNPLGPFKDISTKIVNQKGSFIDGHILMDNGTPYLYYVKDCSENIINGVHVSQIFVQKMSVDFTKLLGTPKLLTEPDQKWERTSGDYQWNEGPFVLKHNKKYYLMYSSNYYASPDYSIGYAVADSPMGPFKKAEENPIVKKDITHGISGPGHNSVTVGPNGKTLYIVYHTHTNPQIPSGDRQMNIDRLYFENGKLKVDGPTYTEQEIIIK